jgi:cyclophilin family peptidyl-prolyl cis-trans isomerase/protein-disulfide isomerase
MRQYILSLILILALAACGSGGDKNKKASAPAAPVSNTATPTEAAIQGELVALPGHTLGPDNAPVTIVIYGDFQSELCARYARDLETLRQSYPGQIRLIWRHLPDQRAHDKAGLALQASEAAAAQGLFWEMEAQLVTRQAEWRVLPVDEFRTLLNGYASTVGLDVDRFRQALDSDLYAPIINQSLQDAASLDILGAPFLLFNAMPYAGRDDLFGFDEAVRVAVLAHRYFDQAPDMTIDLDKTYRATIVTDRGDIVLNLFPQQAPIAVNNFVFLARSGWYDDITFHYVLPGYLAQTGDPSNTGRGSPGYTIRDEHDNGLLFDREGLVAMAHPYGIPNSAGCEFFITMIASDEWNGQYTIFGEVVEGMDIVQSLTPRSTNDALNFPNPQPGDRVITVRIEES